MGGRTRPRMVQRHAQARHAGTDAISFAKILPPVHILGRPAQQYIRSASKCPAAAVQSGCRLTTAAFCGVLRANRDPHAASDVRAVESLRLGNGSLQSPPDDMGNGARQPQGHFAWAVEASWAIRSPSGNMEVTFWRTQEETVLRLCRCTNSMLWARFAIPSAGRW